MTQTTSLTSKVNNNGSWYISYHCKDSRLRYPSGVNAKDDEDLVTSERKRIDAIRKKITEYHDTYSLHKRDILKTELELYLDTEFRPERLVKQEAVKKAVIRTRTLVEDHEEMLLNMSAGKILKKDGNRYSEKSIEQYRRTRERWELCADYYLTQSKGTTKSKELKFILSYEMTIEHCKNLLIWLTENGYKKNSIYDTLNLLKIFLKWAHKGGLHNNQMYMTFSDHISITPEETVAIAPTYNEILQLYQHKFENPNDERARDFFVLGCFLALRVGDLYRINEYQLVKDSNGDYFEVFTEKGRRRVKIPCHWIAREIWNKYKVVLTPWDERVKVPKQCAKYYRLGQLPIFRRNNLRWYLPRLCENFITGTKLVTYTQNGMKVEEYLNRYDMITPHTMRRFFATYMVVELGYKPEEIMPITGHKTRDSFLKYIRVDNEDTMKKISKDAAFIGPAGSSSGLSVVA